MTPEVDNTPGPYIGSGGSVYATTPYTHQDNGGFTP